MPMPQKDGSDLFLAFLVLLGVFVILAAVVLNLGADVPLPFFES
ncbi:MAG: hypothetical protein ABR540_13815 [Acidimicrobiales bacterium]